MGRNSWLYLLSVFVFALFLFVIGFCFCSFSICYRFLFLLFFYLLSVFAFALFLTLINFSKYQDYYHGIAWQDCSVWHWLVNFSFCIQAVRKLLHNHNNVDTKVFVFSAVSMVDYCKTTNIFCGSVMIDQSFS